MEKGQGFEYRWKDWPFTGGRKRALEQTQSYLIFDGRKLREFSYDGYFSMKQEARLSTENEWTVGKLIKFDTSIAGLCYCWGGRWGWWSWIFLGTNLPKWYQSRQHIKKQRHHFADKGPYNQSYGFSSRYVWMWELDHKKCWVLKKWCFQIVCWRRLLRVPWTARR